ncbi:hypothetical protein BDF14DRAFT_1880834 [Spinellus fusiger]|nr:hypothetical protein BDF14DRAFT_1880834 [Spinellus fusiger]
MLAQEIEELNKDTEEDRRIKEAVIMAKSDPNQIAPDDDTDDSSSETDQCKGTQSRSRPVRRRYYYDDDEFEDDLSVRDPELYKITESNRRIILENMPPSSFEENKLTKQFLRPKELVFAEPPITITQPDRIVVSMTYGLSNAHTVKRCKKYLMTFDGGEESKYAMHWAMGTMLRSGDEIHVVSVLNIEEDVEELDSDDKRRLWQEMDRNSKSLISNVRTVLGAMLLHNIKITLYTIAGPTKESLLGVISETPLSMVVCGSRDRNSFKGISTFLVYNSPVPVTVVRPQKTEKRSKKKLTSAQKLSQSVRNGQLRVDEVEGPIKSINSHDGI